MREELGHLGRCERDVDLRPAEVFPGRGGNGLPLGDEDVLESPAPEAEERDRPRSQAPRERDAFSRLEVDRSSKLVTSDLGMVQ